VWKPNPSSHFFPHKFPLFITHRGVHKTVPENTIAAVEKAIESGFTFVELDVIADFNNDIICSHNIDLERETEGHGFVDEKEYSELQHIYCRSTNGNHEQTNIPLLKTILEKFSKKINFVLDVKTRRPLDITPSKKIVELVKEFNLENSIIVSSFNPLFLLVLKWLEPKILTGFIFKNPTHLKLTNIIHPDFLHPRGDIVDEKLINYSNSRNLPINTWTINNTLSWNWLSSMGVCGVITDEIPTSMANRQNRIVE
jgi:glycerophosphoryl diester phosphodiesterase